MVHLERTTTYTVVAVAINENENKILPAEKPIHRRRNYVVCERQTVVTFRLHLGELGLHSCEPIETKKAGLL